MDTQENKTENQKNKIIVFLKEHWISLTIVILALITIGFYIFNFWGNGISNKTDNWGDFGGYIGGIIGTIFAFGAFILMKETLEVQKKEFKNQLKIFNQQQFETTFFKLLDTLNKYKNDENLMQFYLSLNVLYRQLSDYKNNYKKEDEQNFIIHKYNDIIKSNLDKDILKKIFRDENIYGNINHIELYIKIKNIIEQYGLFEFLEFDKKSEMYEPLNSLDFLGIQSDIPGEYGRIMGKYNISAFSNNHYVVPLKIKHDSLLEDDFKKYLLDNKNNNDILFYIYAIFNDKYSKKYIDKNILIEKVKSIILKETVPTRFISLRFRNAIVCMSKITAHNDWHNNDISLIKHITENIVNYFSEHILNNFGKKHFILGRYAEEKYRSIQQNNKTGCVMLIEDDYNQPEIKEWQGNFKKICKLYFSFINNIDTQTMNKENIITIVNYLLNKLLNKDSEYNNYIIIIYFLHKIFSSTNYNYGEVQKIIESMYQKVFPKISPTDIEEITKTFVNLVLHNKNAQIKEEIVEDIKNNKNKLVLPSNI